MKFNIDKLIEYITDPKTKKIPTEAAMIRPHSGTDREGNKRKWGKKEALQIFDNETLEGMFSEKQRSQKPGMQDRLIAGKMSTFEPTTGISFSLPDVNDKSYVSDVNDVVLLVATAAREGVLSGGKVAKKNEDNLSEFMRNLSPKERQRGQELLKEFNASDEARKDFEISYEGETIKIPRELVTQLKVKLGINPLTEEDKASMKQGAKRDLDEHLRKESERRTAEIAAIREIERNTEELRKQNEKLMAQIENNRRQRREIAYDKEIGQANELLTNIRKEVKKIFKIEIARLGVPKKNSIADKQLTALKKANQSLESLESNFEKTLNRRNIDNFANQAVELNVLASNLQAELIGIGYPVESRLDRALKSISNAFKAVKSIFTTVSPGGPSIEERQKDMEKLTGMTAQYRKQLQQLADKSPKAERPEYGKNIPKKK